VGGGGGGNSPDGTAAGKQAVEPEARPIEFPSAQKTCATADFEERNHTPVCGGLFRATYALRGRVDERACRSRSSRQAFPYNADSRIRAAFIGDGPRNEARTATEAHFERWGGACGGGGGGGARSQGSGARWSPVAHTGTPTMSTLQARLRGVRGLERSSAETTPDGPARRCWSERQRWLKKRRFERPKFPRRVLDLQSKNGGRGPG